MPRDIAVRSYKYIIYFLKDLLLSILTTHILIRNFFLFLTKDKNQLTIFFKIILFDYFLWKNIY